MLFANICTLDIGANIENYRSDHFDYIIIDEFHHSAARRYRRAIRYFNPKFLLGLTATPQRTDGKDVVSLLGDNLIYSVTPREAIDRGFLVPFEYTGFKDNIDYSDISSYGFKYRIKDLNRKLIIRSRDDAIVKKYREIIGDGMAIGFCISIEHAIRCAEHFNASGVTSIAIHSEMRREERDQCEEGFRAGKYKVAFVRDIFNEELISQQCLVFYS